MANLVQLKMLEELDGFLLVDKPVGIAFATVVKAVKRKFNLVKVGHGGSLDAGASGLMVVLINDANKFVADVMGADRGYEGAMRLGIKTNTHDIHGETVANGEVPEGEALAEKLNGVLPEYKGDIFQTESRYCSIRREGTAEYEVADTGDHVQFLSHVYKFDFGEVVRGQNGVKLPFTVLGSKSLLVKTLVNDFGDSIGCGACLESLRRTRIGKFTIEQAIPFDKLLSVEMKDFASWVMPLSVALR